MTEQVEQWVCIRFCIKLEHSSVETIGMIQKPQLWAPGDWQLHHEWQCTHSFITSHAEYFWGSIKSPRWLSRLQPRFGALWLLAFPKTEITFEREEISDHQPDSGKYVGTADGDWENCVRSHGSYCEGDWGIIVLCTMFLVSCVFFNKGLYCAWYMDG